jgi:formylglycine-generating enzyme required for sulfatase activity
MTYLRRLRWLSVVLLAMASLLMAGCGDVVDRVEAPITAQPASPGAGGEGTTATQASPTLSPTVIQIRPTHTPPPPPSTPTPLPTNTPAPETQETEEVSGIAVREAMVEIPAGPFILGNDNSDPNEAPAQDMDLPAFMIDAYEVTNADFAAFAEATGYMTYREQQESPQNWRSAYTESKDNHPVVFVTFEDAQAFCKWAGKRLPTEFEWEKAARGPEGLLYPWGNEYDPTLLNGKDSGLRGTTSVGSYPANDYGLFDMAGNVKEWADSPYVAYPGSDYQDSHYSSDYRGIRGGGWFDEAEYVLSTNRNGGDPKITANDDIGFRCAK